MPIPAGPGQKYKNARRGNILSGTLLATVIAVAAIGEVAAQKVRIFAGSRPIFVPVFIADSQGFFTKEGVGVTVRPFASSAEVRPPWRRMMRSALRSNASKAAA